MVESANLQLIAVVIVKDQKQAKNIAGIVYANKYQVKSILVNTAKLKIGTKIVVSV
jgi:hypothetical protein